MPTPRELLERYQTAAEALNDALITLSARIHTGDRGEYSRLRKLVERCKDNLEQAQQEFERGVAEDLNQSKSS